MLLNTILSIALVVHVALIGVCVWRVWRGENGIDRLLNADVIGTLILCVLILIALFERDAIYLDAALGLSALAMIGTIALARFIANKRVI
jgi:multisubunit Na+/H+ antiporter MnhF subunit